MTDSATRSPHATSATSRDFPKPGIVFKDITPLLAARRRRSSADVDRFAEPLPRHGDIVLGDRVARLHHRRRGRLRARHRARAGAQAGQAAARRPTPPRTSSSTAPTRSRSIATPSGTPPPAARPTKALVHRVLVLDDLLATGGTASARRSSWCGSCGGEVVACAFMIELGFLNGRRRLAGQEVFSLVRYDGP